MMKLKSLFRRGHGPPSGSGARQGKRGAGAGAVAAAEVRPEGADNVTNMNGTAGPIGPAAVPPQAQDTLVRSFGSAEIPKQDVPQRETALKAASSVSSLDSKHHKFQLRSKARPVGSQDQTQMANNNNNNHNIAPASVSTMELELESVQGQLEKVSRDKQQLQARVEELSSCQGELQFLRDEVAKLREQRSAEMDCSISPGLHSNNCPPLSDTEKEQLLLSTTGRQKSPAPNIAGSDACPTGSSNGAAGDILDTMCATPDKDRDWDKHSCSSEVSVACLQDRIMQMEETHYSTNEELQATLQELADLQAQLTELQSENERLTDEKGVLLESLCRQTEKLEDSRIKVDTLQDLLLREEAGNGPGGGGDSSLGPGEREQKLVELLKSGQEEREALLIKQDELTTELEELRGATDSHASECARLTDRVRLLESTVDATHAERKQLDQELALAKEESSSRHIEISRLSTLLENARAKIEELEHARELGDRSEIEALLDNVRREKDILEGQVASLQEQYSRSQCEVTKLREQLSSLQEECKVMRNNAKSARSDLEYQCEQVRKEKAALAAELATLQDSVSELRGQCQCHLEDKRQLKAALSETQRLYADVEQRLSAQEAELAEEKRLRSEESAEWEQFQSDLLMTVRVANDFKTEAQHELEKLVLENKSLRDKVRSLESQVEKLKGPGGSRSSSTSSLSSIASDVRAATVAVGATNISPSTPTSPMRHLSDSDSLFKAPLRDQQSNNQNNNNQLHNNNNNLHQNNRLAQQQSRKNLLTDSGKANSLDSLKANSGGKACEDSSQVSQQPLALASLAHHPALTTPVSILAGKSMDYTRRNSCGDLSERKDPLAPLVKNGGSKRNALLKWCQNKTVGYRNIDITNFSSSWNDGLAFCAILHSYLPDRVPYDSLTPNEKRRNFTIAFAAAESVGITTTLNINDMIQLERPDWQQIMAYVTAIYIHFET